MVNRRIVARFYPCVVQALEGLELTGFRANDWPTSANNLLNAIGTWGLRRLNVENDGVRRISHWHGTVQSRDGAVLNWDDRQSRMLKLLRAFVIFLLGLGLGATPSRGGDAPPSEPQMKAAFLLNFPKYVEWPAGCFTEPSSPITVAILGDESVATEFAAMSDGKSVDGHPIKLILNPTAEQCAESHILFIGSGEARKTSEIVTGLKCASVLTVGESDTVAAGIQP